MPHLKEPRTNKCQKRCLGEREKLCTNTSQCTVEEQLALFGLISSPAWCIPVSPAPHTSLWIGEYKWIHEYPPLSSVSLSDWVVSKYILPSCSFTKYPQSSRFYSFEEINQEINDAAVEALPPWKPHSRPRRTWGTQTMTSRAAGWTQRGRSRASGEIGTRAWSCTSTPGVKQGSSARVQCPHIWNRKC